MDVWNEPRKKIANSHRKDPEEEKYMDYQNQLPKNAMRGRGEQVISRGEQIINRA